MISESDFASSEVHVPPLCVCVCVREREKGGGKSGSEGRGLLHLFHSAIFA